MNNVSVIIPLYKLLENQNKEFFNDLVNSLAKNKKYIKEIITINDYPEEDNKDFVLSVVNKYDLLNQFIYKTNEKNIGQAASRNIGIKYASGNYLHFIDQDDKISENFYENMLSSNSNDSDFFLADIVLFNKETRFFYKNLTKKILHKTKNLNHLYFFMVSNLAYSPGQYIVKKDFFCSVGGFPILKNLGADDYGVLLTMMSGRPVKFQFCKNSSFFYRIHSNQNKRKLNMNLSLNEFLASFDTKILNYRQKFILFIKKNRFLRPIKIATVRLLFFNSSSVR